MNEDAVDQQEELVGGAGGCGMPELLELACEQDVQTLLVDAGLGVGAV
jgi:hypothetical protein